MISAPRHHIRRPSRLVHVSLLLITFSWVRHANAFALRVMTYNIHAWRDSDHVDNYPRVMEAIKRVQPDICCVNECLHPFVSPGDKEGDKYYEAVKNGKGRGLVLPPDHLPLSLEDSYLSRLARETGLCNYVYGAADETESSFGKVPFGNAILSRYPITTSVNVRLEVEDGDVDLGYQKRTFVDPRQAIIATIDITETLGDQFKPDDAETALGIISTHLDQISEELREKQIQRVVQKSSEILPQDSPRIICGDFNSFRHSDMRDDVWQELCNLYSSRGWGQPNEESLVLTALEDDGYIDTFSFDGGEYPKPTCWTQNCVMRIDHMLMKIPKTKRKNIKPMSHKRVDVDGSDHYPIFVDFEF